MKCKLVFLSLILSLFTCHDVLAGFFLGDEENSLEIRGRVRGFYNYRFDAEEGKKTANRFALDQARIGLRGRVYADFEFELDLEMGEGEVEPRDLWIAYAPKDSFEVRVGQFKVPYSRARMTSKKYILFTKRAGLIQHFVPGRDIGMMCRSRLLEKKLEFYGGVYTGHGQNQYKDDTKGMPLVSFRTAFSPLGRFRYRAGDLEMSPRPLISVGLNAAWSDDASSDPEDFLRTIEGEKILYGVDVSFKYMGFYAEAEFQHARFFPDSGDEFTAGGFMVQAAYLILPPRLEIAVRYDEFNPSDRIRLVTQRTITYGINLYLYGQKAKVQLNYFQRLDLDRTSEKWKKDELRMLFQLFF